MIIFIKAYKLWISLSDALLCISDTNIRCSYQYDVFEACVCDVSVDGVASVLTLGGTTCELRDECLVDNGGCEHICTDQVDGFSCSCFPPPPGHNQSVWILSDNGEDCLGMPSFSSNARLNFQNQFFFHFQTQIHINLCFTDVDECADPTWVDSNCPSPSVCINLPGYYECQRTIGLSKSGQQQEASGTYLLIT